MYDINEVREKIKSLCEKKNIDINKISKLYTEYEDSITNDNKWEDISFKAVCAIVGYLNADINDVLGNSDGSIKKEDLMDLYNLSCLYDISLRELLDCCNNESNDALVIRSISANNNRIIINDSCVNTNCNPNIILKGNTFYIKDNIKFGSSSIININNCSLDIENIGDSVTASNCRINVNNGNLITSDNIKFGNNCIINTNNGLVSNYENLFDNKYTRRHNVGNNSSVIVGDGNSIITSCNNSNGVYNKKTVITGNNSIFRSTTKCKDKKMNVNAKLFSSFISEYLDNLSKDDRNSAFNNIVELLESRYPID